MLEITPCAPPARLHLVFDDDDYQEWEADGAAYLRLDRQWHAVLPLRREVAGQGLTASWGGFEMQHRYEDLAEIAKIFELYKPAVGVELGSAEGGFAVFMADTFMQWRGFVLSIDKVECPSAAKIINTLPNIQFLAGDALRVPHPSIVKAISRLLPALVVGERVPTGGVALYCDNGNKMREMRLYAPYMARGGLLGVHDYETEVHPPYAAALMEHFGFVPVEHATFEALADLSSYPTSLTRFWLRTDPRGDAQDRLEYRIV